MFHLNRVFILCMCLYIFNLVVMFHLNTCDQGAYLFS